MQLNVNGFRVAIRAHGKVVPGSCCAEAPVLAKRLQLRLRDQKERAEGIREQGGAQEPNAKHVAKAGARPRKHTRRAAVSCAARSARSLASAASCSACCAAGFCTQGAERRW